MDARASAVLLLPSASSDAPAAPAWVSCAMAARSIASLSLTFGLVSIPVKLYSATESSAAIRFKLMSPGGARVRQQYVAGPAPEDVADEAAVERTAAGQEGESRYGRARQPDAEPEPQPEPDPEPEPAQAPSRSASSRVIDFPAVRHEPAPPATREPAWNEAPVLERSEMVKGYEYEKGRFVLFTTAELKALEAGSRQTIDIVSFLPEHAVDPLYYDKAYFLAPDKGGAKPYSLLLRAMRETSRCALAKWAFRSKEYLVQIRPAQGGLVLQQLLYADEVRSISDLDIDLVEVGAAELELARRLIEQISAERFDPHQYVDEEKARILAAVEKKIAGKQIVAPGDARSASAAKVVDLVEALRASLRSAPTTSAPAGGAKAQKPTLGDRRPAQALAERKPARRAPAKAAKVAAPAKNAPRKGRGGA